MSLFCTSDPVADVKPMYAPVAGVLLLLGVLVK
jgi:hypothetical protein